MKKQIVKNSTPNETETFNSRRKFIKNLACGSLLAICGSGAASAAVRHATKAVTLKDKHPGKIANSHKDLKTSKIAGKHKESHLATVASKHQDQHSSRLAHNHIEIHEHIREHDVIHTARHNEVFGRKHHFINSTQENDDLIVSRPNDLRSRQFAGVHRSYLSNGLGPSHKTLAMQNMNTGEKIKLTYFEQGRYIPESLSEISHLFRDHHTDEVHPVDAALLDQLHDLQISLGINKPYSVVCGYRSPATNGMMHFFSRGVAKHSLHMEGRATDIRIEGVSIHDIKTAALALGRGGVGYYPSSNFVHLDTGDVRTW